MEFENSHIGGKMSAEFTLSYPENSIALIQQNVKNFSVEGFHFKQKLFDEVKNNKNAKVLVISGSGSFYSLGGDEKIMIDIVTGNSTFDNFLGKGNRRTHDSYFDFPLPIITAMQGHAFGYGFVEGFYSDLLVLSETSVYSARFMKHGFTPGEGTTFFLPHYLGKSLAWEMMFTGEFYTGKELRERGASMKVVPQKTVLSTALKLANELTQIDLEALKILKSYRISQIRENVEEAMTQELKMHNVTMQRSEVTERIKKMFRELK